MKAIQTRYKNYKFRSRTEAKWAVFFDSLGLRWEYEIEGFEFDDGVRYLPDFYFPDQGLWAEIKGALPTARERNLCRRLADARQEPVLMLAGTPGHLRLNKHLEIADGALVLCVEPSDKTLLDGAQPESTEALAAVTATGRVERLFLSADSRLVWFPQYMAEIGKNWAETQPPRLYTDRHPTLTPTLMRSPILMPDGSLQMGYALYQGHGERYDEERVEPIRRAIAAARSARFEHGESGPT